MYFSYIKAFYNNKKRIKKYIYMYILILFMFNLTLIFNNYIKMKIFEITEQEDNRIINVTINDKIDILPFVKKLKEIKDIKYIEYYVYNDFGDFIIDFLKRDSLKNIDENYSIYIPNNLKNIINLKEYNIKTYNSYDNNIYCNFALSLKLYQDYNLKHFSVKFIADSYDNVNYIIEQLDNLGLSSVHAPYNQFELKTYNNLYNIIKIIIGIELLLMILMILISILMILYEHKKDVLLLHSLGYSIKQIINLIILETITFLTFSFILNTVILTFAKILLIVFWKDYISIISLKNDVYIYLILLMLIFITNHLIFIVKYMKRSFIKNELFKKS